MKVPNLRDFMIYVQPLQWAIASDHPELLSGGYMVALNARIEIRFVPDVSEFAPPWDIHEFNPAVAVESRPEARIWAMRTSDYSATPNPGLAGTAETVLLLPYADDLSEGETDRGVVWYIDTAQWAALVLELEDLSGRTNPFGRFVTLSEITGNSLWHFLTERFLTSDLLAHETVKVIQQAR
ncbi:hypothetical protein IU449_24600 [Nocardia higoensis]|uniref:Uncharacterized protein n=1 Tax=Nocardia higoensis TaxID=228599 RepID=A0ABS0DGU5_9NOCA|nr:hypothetical protein [Nocardia higoensis]MBF6357690.1 hypothetical protein [Nocardia higoensis]